MKPFIVLAIPILASAAFALENSSHIVKENMNCSDNACCRQAQERTAAAADPRVMADPGAEMRFRMKFGRNTAVEEARQKTMREEHAKNTADRAANGCCSDPPARSVAAETPIATADPGAEMRYRMKYGRNTAAEEARQKTMREEYAKNTADRAANGCCSDLPAESVAAETPVVIADPGAEMRYRMKYGRNTPAEERRRVRESQNVERMLASADRMMCSADCCRRYKETGTTTTISI